MIPHSYELELKPYIGDENVYGDRAFTLDGRIKISFECKIRTSEIVFHAKELDLISLSLSSVSDPGLSINREGEYDAEREFFRGTFTRECKESVNYTLLVAYKGLINDKLSGFYRSSYFDQKSNQTF